MRDVLPPDEHRSIRNIPLPANRRAPQTRPSEPLPPSVPPQYPEDHDPYLDAERPRRKTSWFLWICALGLVAVLISVILAFFLRGATITVSPRKSMATLPASLLAYVEAPIGELPYETVTATETASRTVPASGEAQVERRATGTVTIYNTFNTSPQRLIKNTRFEAKDGKIYRIDQSVTVPGATKGSDGTLTPGTIDAVIFADSPGAEYNKGQEEFTIPGFKGDPRYDKFKAKGKTPIEGGFVGTEKTVADADRTAAREGIKAELSEKLRTQLEVATPDGYTLIFGSEYFSYEDLPQGGDAQAAVFSMRATATAAVIREAELAAAIAKQAVPQYAGEALRFEEGTKLSDSVKATAALDIDTTKLSLALSGQVALVWQIDAGAIKRALLGKSETEFAQIIKGFEPAVASASAAQRPFWEKNFPTEEAEIHVKIGDATLK